MESQKDIIDDVLIVIPTLNEEEGIGPTLKDLYDVLEHPHCLVIDGNSSDDTIEIAKDFGAEVLLQKGEGKGQAIEQVLQHLHSPRYVVFIDGDYTYPAEYIPKMLGILDRNLNAGMVTGNRFASSSFKEAMTFKYYLGNKLLAFFHRILSRVDMKDPLTGLRAVKWDVLKGWQPKSRGFDIEVELNHFITKMGFKIVEIPIHYRERLGKKKLSCKNGLTILKRILSISFTKK